VDNTDKCFIIESQQGFIFDGEFVHAGAIVSYPGYDDSNIIQRIEGEFMRLKREEECENDQIYETIFNSLCTSPHVDAISRLHALVLPKDSNLHQKPNNVVRILNINLPEL
jgi:hypothetical protein